MTLKRGQLGQTELTVSELGLGTARLGGVFTSDDAAKSIRLILHAMDSGINLLDTSNIYGQGAAEKYIGRALSGHRDDAVICTKAGFAPTGAKRAAPAVKTAVRPLIRALGIRRSMVPGAFRGSVSQDFSKSALRASAIHSLRRLGVESVDVFLLHSPPEEVLWQPETREALRSLQSEGIARVIGVSLADGSPIKIPEEIQVVQAPVSVLSTPAFTRMLQGFSDRGIGVIGRQCFASGKLTTAGPLAPADPEAPKVEMIRRSAAARGESVAQAAFSQVHGRFGLSSTLLGAHHLEHIDQAVGWLRVSEAESQASRA